MRPFTPAQIKLLETFADQAVIAIENVRLFQELKESLEQQTATSEVLGVIASSPTDIQPVLDVVAENAARLCEASDTAIWRSDGANFWLVASQGSIPVPLSEGIRPLTRGIPSARAMIDRETVHIHDLLSPNSLAEFTEAVRSGGIRTVLVAPLLREGLAIGAIHVRRPEVRPFPTSKSLSSKPSPTKRSSPSKTSGCSKNSRSHWSSRLQRVKSWASSPARRRISNPYSTWSPKTRPVCVRQTTRQFGARKATSFGLQRRMDRSRSAEPRKLDR